MQSKQTYQSLDRGLRVIESIAAINGSATLAEIARKTALPRSTAHHLLQALVEFGYLVQDEQARTYTLAPKLFRLTGRAWTYVVRPRFDVRKVAAYWLLEKRKSAGLFCRKNSKKRGLGNCSSGTSITSNTRQSFYRLTCQAAFSGDQSICSTK